MGVGADVESQVDMYCCMCTFQPSCGDQRMGDRDMHTGQHGGIHVCAQVCEGVEQM